MKDLLDKISSYNLFNYLLPGVLFAVAGERFTAYSLMVDDLVVGVFVYYFYGLSISRIGSLVVGPLMKRLGFLKFSNYEDFIVASNMDPKIELLSEINNMYRTLIATISCVAVLCLVSWTSQYATWIASAFPFAMMALLFCLFVAAYRKQTSFIVLRIFKSLQAKDSKRE